MTLIAARDISVDVPIYDVGGASLRKMILGATVGGRFRTEGHRVVVKALRNVSFEAHDGDRIGLIGRNGSGKTSLLRVLAGVYTPSSGQITVTGRVAPVLDAMLGMNPDATGIENIRTCGVLWGNTRAQVDAGIPDIAAFTELGDYLNLPLRTYSAGMQLRLAFAIATLREPDILLLDEVIGVGDAEFHHKAYARLRQLVDKTRVMFVATHAHAVIRDLCNKVIWLSNGELKAAGAVEETLAAYEESAR